MLVTTRLERLIVIHHIVVSGKAKLMLSQGRRLKKIIIILSI